MVSPRVQVFGVLKQYNEFAEALSVLGHVRRETESAQGTQAWRAVAVSSYSTFAGPAPEIPAEPCKNPD